MSNIYYIKIDNEFFDVYASFKAIGQIEANWIAKHKYGSKCKAKISLPKGAILSI